MAVNGKENAKESNDRLPGQISRDVPGFKVDQPVSEGIKMGNLGGLVEKLHAQGKHVVAQKHPGRLVFIVAASALLVGAVAGARLRKRKDG